MASETEIANLGLGKIGGAGEQLNGNGFLVDINDNDRVSVWCKLNFPRVRRRVIIDLAVLRCPFRSTIRFDDLGAQLDSDETPEIGQYQYAFNLPGNCLEMTRQFFEASIATRATVGPVIYENQWETVANKDGTGKVLLTNFLTNLDGTSAFIEYAIDTPNTGSFTEQMIDCVATLLASEVAPMVGKNMQVSLAMLEKYELVTIPKAQAANQRGFNKTAKRTPDYSGGRSTTTPFPAVNTDLGTYVNAQGDRRDVI